MLKLFGTTDSLFSSNGDKILIPTYQHVIKEDNGEFYLDVELPLSYIDDITPNRLLVSNTPQGDQAFRITNVENRKTKIKFEAKHISYDSMNYVIQDSYVVDKDCNSAINHLNNATDTLSPFTVSSNISLIASYRCVRKSLYEAWQVLLERYGGHLVRDNYNVAINSSIGQDNGVVVRYAKNLKDITASYDWSAVATKLLPVGKDGLLLPEVWLTSGTQYDIPYTKVVSFSQDNINEQDYKDEDGNVDEVAYQNALIDDLRSEGTEYLIANAVPKVNYTLQANLEKISDVGDTVLVKDERLGIDITTNIISFDYDCILEKYSQLQFGNFKKTLNNLMSSITASTEQIVDDATSTTRVYLEEELKQATDTIWGTLGNSYVIYEGDKILIVDRLPKESAVNCIMLNSGGIGFSNTGINGTFSSAWTIKNELDLSKINVLNLSASMISSGTLKLGNQDNQNGVLEVYDESNTLIAELNKDGLKMYAQDGGYILINTTVGFSGYDRNGTRVYWADGDTFHMKKAVIEEMITLVDKMNIIPITIYNGNNEVVNDGIAFVGTL
jgi:phage minor structural protein